MNSKFADLHVHSNFSDGTFSPSKIVSEARRVTLDCISITDHDTADCIDPAIMEAGTNLEVLPGVELTAEYSGQEIHILGYLIDHHDKTFLKMLERMREARVARIYGICEKLKKLGFAVEPKDIFDLAGKGSVGRLHVARALLGKGHVFSIQEAFYRFIGDKGPAYVGKFRMTPKEAIDWILKVKGIPVLAHPYTLTYKILIADLVKDGLMGIEAYYTEHSDSQTQEYIKIAQKHGLLITGGSDCHGEAKEQVSMGRVRLPYEYVEKLKEAKCRLK
ncbi:MAG: PHP domain-containing protein [Candidatus Omnitrophica bacterium]|nr:PHP domain-containing protein [Candidatus Omnitrophota bacterium]